MRRKTSTTRTTWLLAYVSAAFFSLLGGCNSKVSTTVVSSAEAPNEESREDSGSVDDGEDSGDKEQPQGLKASDLAEKFLINFKSQPGGATNVSDTAIKGVYGSVLGSADLANLDATASNVLFAHLTEELLDLLLGSAPGESKAALTYAVSEALKATLADSLPSAQQVGLNAAIDAAVQSQGSTDGDGGSDSGLTPSVVASPVFMPIAGTYTSVQNVTISSSTPGVTIYYTTDGSNPTTSSSTYGGAIAVGASQVLKAIAVKAGWTDSSIQSANYTINLVSPPGSFSVTSATAGNAEVALSWSASTGATSYEVRRGTSAGTYPTSVTTTTSTSYTDTSLVNGTTYYYQITASNSGGTATATGSATPVTISLSQSTVTLSSASIVTGATTIVTLTAKDTLGNQQSDGGLTVVFGLGSGSSDGSFSPVTDNDDGTYSATFTASTAGTARALTATIGGQSVTSTMPTITVTTPPVTNSWSDVSTDDMPQLCTRASVVWTGTEMIVFGGGCAFTSNEGGRYNPATDTWTPTATLNAPPTRMYHSAVWTGTEMIVWGGTNSFYENSGGRYNPANDTWTATTTSGAPAARQSHSAVWTGSEMIIYGGNSHLGSHNDGKAYTPGASDSWSDVTNNPGAMEWGSAHNAVWVGSKLILSSGYNADRLAYTRGTDTWSTISNGTGAPSQRHAAVGVAAGTKVILWGGWMYGAPMEPVYYYNDGGIYDPGNDTWEAIPSAGAPAGRMGAVGVWTGSKLIVWGGSDENGPLNSGGIYDPATTTWTAISATGAPTDGIYAAVWTGTQMIVWGYKAGTGNFAKAFTP